MDARRPSELVAPSDLFAFTDSRGRWGGQTFPQWEGWDWTLAGIGTFDPLPFGQDGYQGLENPPQHGKYFNVLYADGHVTGMRLVELFYPAPVPPNSPFIKTAADWNIDHKPHSGDWDEIP
ncbi:MAG: hypothetical protein ACLQVY_07555 [Limisphaerales bacterium]